MNALATTLFDGLRLLVLRAPRGRAITAGPGVFFALVVLHVLLAAGITAQAPWAASDFDPSGVTIALSDALLLLIAAWWLVRSAGRTVIWGAAAILLAANVFAVALLYWPLDFLLSAADGSDRLWLAGLLVLVILLWWLLALWRFAHWLAPRRLARSFGAALLAWLISTAALWWSLGAFVLMPTQLASVEADADSEPATADEPTFDAEKLMYEQPALLDAALAKIKPQTPGRIDLYVVAFAGDAQENVFRNEAEYVERLFTQRFDAAGRVLVLENNVATLAQRPLASWTNLQRSLDAIAKKMDPAEDILLLYLTSHGSAEHELLVDLDPLPLNQIAPDDLADALKTVPALRWKVVVVNACYSGGFVDALRDDSSLIVTAARADRTSFGCGADSDITYFAKAFLVEALNRTNSFREAFDLAKTSIAQWEADEKLEASEPQIASTPSIEAKLAAWQHAFTPGAAVPFVPAASGDDDGAGPNADRTDD